MSMAEVMQNPFKDYQVPSIEFTRDLCVWVIQRKADRLSEHAAQEMLQGTNMADFLAGTFELELDYDSSELKPFVTFISERHKLKFICEAIVTGLSAAFHLSGVENPPENVYIAPAFHEEMPEVANMRVSLSAD